MRGAGGEPGRRLESTGDEWALDGADRACPSVGRGPSPPDHAWLAATVGFTAGASVCTVNRER